MKDPIKEAVAIQEARGWLEDCGILDEGWSDETEDEYGFPEAAVRELVEINYDGGWAEFLSTCSILFDEEMMSR